MGWSFKAISSFATFAACVSLQQPARAEAAPPPEWLATRVNESGQHCVPLAEHRQDDQLLLACGAAGVWEFALREVTPRFIRSYALAGDVVGFIVEPDGRVWVKLQVLQARPFATAAAPSAAAVFPDVALAAPSSVATIATAPPPAVPISATARNGRVVRATPGEVVISLGSLDGITRGDHIEFALEGENGSEEDELAHELIVVGVVTKVAAQSARVRLGVNESVPVRALASPTHAQPTSSLSAPPRVSGLWELELFARPFAALDELGGGILLSGSVGYRFTHLHLQAVVDPLAFAAVQTKQSVTAANAALIASYDSQYFEMGLGLGAQTVNESGFRGQPGSGLAAVQLIRLGARDGLNFSARTSVALFRSEFQFGGMVASAQIPVTRGYWFLLNGGGGNVGYGFGELGLRMLVSGNGLAGSKFLTVTAGGVSVFRSGDCSDVFSACTERLTYGGPMAGIAGEWRF